jgi:hypothetical protein
MAWHGKMGLLGQNRLDNVQLLTLDSPVHNDHPKTATSSTLQPWSLALSAVPDQAMPVQWSTGRLLGVSLTARSKLQAFKRPPSPSLTRPPILQSLES